MQHHVFILLLILGSVLLTTAAVRKYYLIQQNKTWSDAQAHCQVNYTDLATVQTSADMVQLGYEAQRNNFSSGAWIGLYSDIDSWRFSFENTSLQMVEWEPGEPNNWGGREECGMMNKFGWFDGACDLKLPFVCFDDRSNGTDRYLIKTTTSTWHEAQSYCRQYHTDLASTRDPDENQIVQGLTSDLNPDYFRGWAWFGLFRDSWKWSDQTNVSTIKLMNLQLNSKTGNDNCGYFNSVTANAKCSDLKTFYCYSDLEPIERQTLRLKIQSDQDLNDPAVKEAILEQIEEKLEEHGLSENITLKWREQPDGVVFKIKKTILL